LTKEEMKNCVWLKPKLFAMFEFTEWTPDGHLRHSKFVGMREDKAALERLCKRLGVSYDSEALPGWVSVSNESRDRSLLRQGIKTHS
jgi:bifunctional non-homologous end joining protein LigD